MNGRGVLPAEELQRIGQKYLDAGPAPAIAGPRLEPSWREQLAQLLLGGEGRPSPERRRLVEGLLGTSGLPGSEQLGLADFVPPAAAAFGANELERASRTGDVLAGIGAAFGAVPFAGAAPRAAATAAKAARATAPVAAEIAAPAIHAGGEASPATIAQIQAAARAQADKPWATATQPVFDTSAEALERTYRIVPQQSVRDVLPTPQPGEKLPLGGRVQPVIEATPQIATAIANRLRPAVEAGDPLKDFYATGPIIEGLQQHAGLDEAAAVRFMHDWSGFGAATSPQTKTPRNLRNASFMQYRYGQGDPVPTVAEGWTSAHNVPGYPLMGEHTNLARRFAENTVDPWQNPKPYTFREGWSGNVADVVADTHNIRATLLELEKLYPGAISRGYFSPRGWDAYQAGGLMAPITPERGGRAVPLLHSDEMAVAPKNTSVGGRTRRAEFGAVAAPWYQAAEQLGIRPGQAQSLGWFHYGPETGLASPPSLIPDLLNDQIEATAKATGQSPETILRLWGQRRIPLSANEAASRIG